MFIFFARSFFFSKHREKLKLKKLHFHSQSSKGFAIWSISVLTGCLLFPQTSVKKNKYGLLRF